MDWCGSQEQQRYEGKYAEEEGEEKEEAGQAGGEQSNNSSLLSPVAEPFDLGLFADDSGSQDVIDEEWEDRYDRPAGQQREKDSGEDATVAAPVAKQPTLSADTAKPSTAAEQGAACVIDLVTYADVETSSLVDVADDGVEAASQPVVLLTLSRKRRRLNDSQLSGDAQPPATPTSAPQSERLSPGSTSVVIDLSGASIEQQQPQQQTEPDSWSAQLLAQLDEALQLRVDDTTAPLDARLGLQAAADPPPPWSSTFPPLPPPSSNSSLPFPRPLRPVQPLSACSLMPLLHIADSTAPNPTLQLSDSVRLFGTAYDVDCLHVSLPSLFERMEATLLTLHCSLLDCPLPASAVDGLRSEVDAFLSTLRAYLEHVLPTLSSLHRTLLLFVLETCCMQCCERLLAMRLPALAASTPVPHYCDVLHSFLLVHSHMLYAHAVLAAHRGSSPTSITVSVQIAGSPSSAPLGSGTQLRLPPPATRWPLSSHLFYLLLDLLSLHQRFPSIGRMKQAELSPASSLHPSHQPVLSLWHCVISYTDRLHDARHEEAHNRGEGRGWSNDEHYYRMYSHADAELTTTVCQRWNAIEATSVAGQPRASEDVWMDDVDDERVFPCFYQLLNSVLVPFLTDPLFSGPPTPSSPLLLSLRRQPLSPDEVYDQCGVRGTEVVMAVSREQLCDRVEVLWEALMDCIIPAYTLPPLSFAHSCAALPASRPVDLPALCATYSIYDSRSDLDTSQGVSLRCHLPVSAGEQCVCRPHWSLLSFLLRAGLQHVTADYRLSYSTTVLSRLSSIVHVWPCIDADHLMRKLYQLTNLTVNSAPASLLSHLDTAEDVSEERLEYWPGSLLDEDVRVSLAPTGGDKRWQLYLRVMFVYLRMMAEAKPASSPNALSPPMCTLLHNNSSHHSLLFHSFNKLPLVLSDLYAFFQSPSPPPRYTCDCHEQLERLSQQVSIYLLAALVSPDEAGRAAMHLKRLMDYDNSCYHAQSFMLRCWCALASLRIKHGLAMGDTLRDFLAPLRQSIQLHMDAEEECEVRQCELWNEPRDWSEELKREKQKELTALREQLRPRRKRMLLNLQLLRRLMQCRFAVRACVEADHLDMLGMPLGSDYSKSFVFDMLGVERPVPLPMRMMALRLVEDTLQFLQVPAVQVHRPAAAATAVPVVPVAEDASQMSDDSDDVMVAAAAQAEQQAAVRAAVEKRRTSVNLLRKFLEATSLQLTKRIDYYFSDVNQNERALLLLNTRRASLQADIEAGRTSNDSYEASKRGHRTTKTLHRRPGDNNVDDAYRVKRDMLLLCIKLHADIAHTLIQEMPQQAAFTVKEFGLVVDAQAMEAKRAQLKDDDVALFRYRFLHSYYAFLSSAAYNSAASIEQLLKSKTDQAALLRSLLFALTESDEVDVPREQLRSVLHHLLSLPLFARYQQPAVDVQRVFESVQSMQQGRAEIISSLVGGVGALLPSSSSSSSSSFSSTSTVPSPNAEVAATIPSPAFLAHLSQQMTRIVNHSLSQRRDPAAAPTLSAAAVAHLTLLYHTIDEVLLHCIPLLRPSPEPLKPVQLLDELLATWIDPVWLPNPAQPAGSVTPPRPLCVPSPRHSAVQHSLAESLWRSVVWCVHKMEVQPGSTYKKAEWNARLCGLVSTTKNEDLWPHNAGVSRPSHTAALTHAVAPFILTRLLV